MELKELRKELRRAKKEFENAEWQLEGAESEVYYWEIKIDKLTKEVKEKAAAEKQVKSITKGLNEAKDIHSGKKKAPKW